LHPCVRGVIVAKAADWKLSGSLYGAKFCENPEDAAAVRYNLTLTVDELSFADGLLNISNAVVNAQGRAPYRSPEDYDLTFADWKITVSADVTVNVDVGASDGFAMKVWGNAHFSLDMGGQNPAVANASVSATSGRGFSLTKARIDTSIALTYRGAGGGFNMVRPGG
jgi:hypothetical protein